MGQFPELVRALTTLLITIIISMISYELMERQFINLKDKYFSKSSDGEHTSQTSAMQRRI
jgi:peptidoglycan/LPS O-acetylase OafA/YrhL